MWRLDRDQEGFALVLVMMMVIILSLTLLTVSVGMRTQADSASGMRETTIAVARAEDGIHVAFARLKNGVAFSSGNSFTINNGGWSTQVRYYTQGGVDKIQATARRGRYSRTVDVVAGTTTSTQPGAPIPNPLNNYYIASGGTMSLTNGSYDIRGNTLYAKNIMTLGSCYMTSSTGQGTLISSETVNTSNMGPLNNVREVEHAPKQNIPDVDWSKFADAAYKTYNNVSSNLDVSNDLKTANGGIIVVRVTGGSPQIKIGADDFSNKKATIVIIKDNPSAKPELVVGNGTYSNTEINAFVDGKVNFSSGYFKTKGVLYATGDIYLTNGTYEITGGVSSKTNVTTTSVSFGVYNPQWDQWGEFFEDLRGEDTVVTTYSSLGQWREL